MPTSLRTYREVKVNGKRKLQVVTWIQLKCVICGRFLPKGSKKVCRGECESKWRNSINRKWMDKHPHYHRELRHSKDSSIPYRNRKII